MLEALLFLFGLLIGLMYFCWGTMFFLACCPESADGQQRKSAWRLILEIAFSTPFLAFFNPFPFLLAYLAYYGYKLSLGELNGSGVVWVFWGIICSLLWFLLKLRRNEPRPKNTSRERSDCIKSQSVAVSSKERVEFQKDRSQKETVEIKEHEAAPGLNAFEKAVDESAKSKDPCAGKPINRVFFNNQIEQSRKYVQDLDVDTLPGKWLMDDIDQIAKEDFLRKETVGKIEYSLRTTLHCDDNRDTERKRKNTFENLKNSLSPVMESFCADADLFSKQYTASKLRQAKFALEYLVLAVFSVNCVLKVMSKNHSDKSLSLTFESLEKHIPPIFPESDYVTKIRRVYPQRSVMYLNAINSNREPVEEVGRLFAQVCLDGTNKNMVDVGRNLVSRIAEKAASAILNPEN